MKHFFYTLSFVSLVLLASCQKTALPQEEFEGPAESLTAQEIAFEALQNKMERLKLLETKAAGLLLEDLVPIYRPGSKAGEDLPAAFMTNFKTGGFALVAINEVEVPGTKIAVKKATVGKVVAVTTSGQIAAAPTVTDAYTSNSTSSAASSSASNTESTPQGFSDATSVYIDLNNGGVQSSTAAAADDDADADSFPDIISIDTEYLSRLLTDAIRKSDLPDVYQKPKDYGPLIDTEWGQEHFGQYAKNPAGSKKVCGCVVLAIMEIMAYNNYPCPEIFYPYTVEGWIGNTWADFRRFESTRKDNEPLSSGEEDFLKDRGSLIAKVLGEPLNCNVRSDASGTWSNARKAKRTFANYGFKNVRRKTGCDPADMKNIDAMIIAGKPVFMSGNMVGCDVGHAWVVDGLSADMYHINWGWDGLSNGWFAKGMFNALQAREFDGYINNDKKANFDHSFEYILYE